MLAYILGLLFATISFYLLGRVQGYSKGWWECRRNYRCMDCEATRSAKMLAKRMDDQIFKPVEPL